MKKILFALAATALVSTPALADTTTISGDVAPVCTIDGPPDTATIQLGNGARTQPIGNVAIQCNSASGYSATASSANGGILATGVRTAARFGYTLQVGNAAAVSLATPQTVASSSGDQQSVVGYTLPVAINSVTNQNNGPVFAGRYSDVITWTITAN